MSDKTTNPTGVSLRRNSPWSLLRSDFDRVFDNFFDEMRWPALSFKSDITSAFNPKINVSETDKELRVVAELPGLDEKDVSAVIDNDMLEIKGEKKTQHETKEENYHTRECSYGSFRRIIGLPAYIDRDKIEAKFNKGVLTVTLPKTAEAVKQQKKIEIKAG